jgi:hypothetical protein
MARDVPNNNSDGDLGLVLLTNDGDHDPFSQSVNIVYRKISSELYWGMETKSTRYNRYLVAEPEKALLDWIYLSRQEGLPTALDELHVQFLDLAKLRDYADRFPRTVREVVREILVNRSLAPQSQEADHPRAGR